MVWITRRMTPAEIRARDVKEIRRKGGDAAVRKHKLEESKKAAMKMTNTTEAGWRKLDGPQQRARETVAKWKMAKEQRLERAMLATRISKPTLSQSAIYHNPTARRNGEKLWRPPPGTRDMTFFSLIENVNKEIEKSLKGPKGKAIYAPTAAQKAEAAHKVDVFAKRTLRDITAIMEVPKVDFETKVWCLDAAVIIIGMCVNTDHAIGKNLRQTLADSEEWSGHMRMMFEKLSDAEIKRVFNEMVLGTLFPDNLGDTRGWIKDHKMWPNFEKDTIKYYLDRAKKVKTEVVKDEPENGPRRSRRKKST